MNIKRSGGIAAIALIGAFALASCAANETPSGDPSSGGSDISGTIAGVGASSQGAAEEAWISAFQTANGGATVTYDPQGSGAGREAFIAGGANFAGTDSALKQEEIDGGFAGCVDGSGYIQVPAYISPIAIVFNVEGVDSLQLDAATAAGIFKGDITKWNDPAIVALNDGVSLPDADITAVHRSDDSGTTKNFADWMFQNAGDVWDADPADTFPYSAGEAAAKTAGVIDAVTNGTNTIGYADASAAGDLGQAAIKVGDAFVAPSAEAAAKVVAESPESDTAGPTDLSFKINRTTTAADEYPAVLVSYVIACTEYKDAAVAPVVQAYLEYITSQDGQSVAASAAGSAPLTSELSDKVKTILDGIKVS